MSTLFKPLFSLLLLMMFIINPISVAFSMDLNSSNHQDNCDMSIMDMDAGKATNTTVCPMMNGDSCLSHVSCVSHVNSLIKPSSFSSLSSRTPSLLKIITNNDRIQVKYSDLLERPPKA